MAQGCPRPRKCRAQELTNARVANRVRFQARHVEGRWRGRSCTSCHSRRIRIHMRQPRHTLPSINSCHCLRNPAGRHILGTNQRDYVRRSAARNRNRGKPARPQSQALTPQVAAHMVPDFEFVLAVHGLTVTPQSPIISPVDFKFIAHSPCPFAVAAAVAGDPCLHPARSKGAG